ncbi:26.5 kDa heat shock protein, mitochondrial [Heracleum sosnowskyi]|uniref:26.5 kDa heat shock protein, mitochondrial n=1 Tax=Heracleum sosnowskyi TaxID=360622 RepID=A0AAD8M3I1_9APIA|nr:26.5 kDa heat shock protein, mitochondrial [Heracleum sosnowskyi]
MALARLAFKKLHKGAISVPSSSFMSKEQRWSSELMNRLFTTSSSPPPPDEATSGEVAVSSPDQSGKKSKLFSKKQRNRQLWRNNHNFVPSLWEFFPSGLGNALMQATENINRGLENMGPSQLLGRFKEKKECYKLKYEMPGMAKDEVKITVEDGVLRIRGEHKEDHEEAEDEEQHYWSSRYGYYDTRLVLPDDAKVEEIKAEMKDGVLKITIPRSEKQQRDVKEVQVQ